MLFIYLIVKNKQGVPEPPIIHLLPGDKFIPEMHLKQPGFTYSTCGPFTKNKEKIQKIQKLEMQAIFTKMNSISLVFNMIWLMEVLKV